MVIGEVLSQPTRHLPVYISRLVWPDIFHSSKSAFFLFQHRDGSSSVIFIQFIGKRFGVPIPGLALIHFFGIPIALTRDGLWSPMRPDSKLGIAKPFRILVLFERFIGWFKFCRTFLRLCRNWMDETC